MTKHHFHPESVVHDGRLPDEPTCPVVVFRFVLPVPLLKRLSDDVDKVLESDFVPSSNPNSLTFGTYWWSPSCSASPRNAIEEVIWHMRDEVLPRVLDVDAMAGAEWWLQDTDCEDTPKEYHVDADVQITDGESTHSMPCMSSVFYLDSVGGPTVACGQTKTPEGDLEPRIPQDMAVVFPRENQLMTFRGDLYHAVLRPRAEFPRGLSRRTLLVNWWPIRPGGPADLPAPFCFPRQSAWEMPPSMPEEPTVPPQPAQFTVCFPLEPFVEHQAEWVAQRVPEQIWQQLESERHMSMGSSEAEDSVALPLYVSYSRSASAEEGGEGRPQREGAVWSSLLDEPRGE